MVATWTASMWNDDLSTVDHPEVGHDRLLWQYRGDQVNLQAFLEALLNDQQSIEDVSIDVLVNRWPLTAVGEQLDMLGKIVGQARGDFVDDQYRLFILARILVNKGNGRAEELIHILDTLGSETIIVDEGTAEIRIDTTSTEYSRGVGDLMLEAKAGGVRLDYVYNEELAADSFQFSDTLGAGDTDTDSGWGDIGGVAQTVGGQLSGGRSS